MSTEKQIRYNRSGWISIIIGVLCFLLFLIDYHHSFLLKYTNLSDLGAIIAATTGICFSLAGLFFVLDNLVLQRETLIQQNTAINLQKAELKIQNAEMKASN